MALLDVGIRRFRLMSYWDLHEPEPGTYDFEDLDAQINIIRAHGGSISLCIGIRQPRWPESHLPQWALELPAPERTAAYLRYHQAVIERYKDEPILQSWQLENEFWNRGFGMNNEFSRSRLRQEFSMLRTAAPAAPVIMSLGNTVGLPLGAPKPDLFGTTLYLIQYEKGRYTRTKYGPWYFKLRRNLVRLFGRRDLIIHELQAEPWGPQANWEMSDEEQNKSMNADQLERAVRFGRDTGMTYMDLWGGEWWYWRSVSRSDDSLLERIRKLTS